MRPFKPGTRNDQIVQLLSNNPLSVSEIAATLDMSRSNTSACLKDIKNANLARQIVSGGKAIGWIRNRKSTTAPPKPLKTKKQPNPSVRLTPATAPLSLPVEPDITTALDTSSAINILIQTEQQNITYRRTLQQVIAIYEQLGTVLEAAGLLEE